MNNIFCKPIALLTHPQCTKDRTKKPKPIETPKMVEIFKRGLGFAILAIALQPEVSSSLGSGRHWRGQQIYPNTEIATYRLNWPGAHSRKTSFHRPLGRFNL